MSWRERAKEKVAQEVSKLVKTGFVIGLGSGSTVAYAIQKIGYRARREGIRIMGIPTSHQSSMLAVENGIPLTTLNEHPTLDLAIDGADQIDGDLNLIKGMGGALTREKIVAFAAKKLVIVADETKLVEKLGRDHPLPVEVVPFALPTVMLSLKGMGGTPILRNARNKVGPVITDNGNFVVDVDLGPINDPKQMDLQLNSIPGLIETGLFIDIADTVYVGGLKTVKVLKRKQ